MRAGQLRRELRRIARREVPAGEPDLWPEIRRQLAPGREAGTRPGGPRPELESVYEWRADEGRAFPPWLRAAVAVVVLVLAGGLLAAQLLGHGGQPSQGVVNAVSPVSPANPGHGLAVSLPLTVTAGGIPITLESVEASGSTTRFTFTIRLPPYAAESSGYPIVMPLKVTDVQVDGLADPAPAPTFGQSLYLAGQPTASLSVTFDAPVEPGQPVTFTLLELAFATPPDISLPPGIATIGGPWTFAVAPDVVRAPAPTLVTWTRSGRLTVPIAPLSGSRVSGTVRAQILPAGDLRLAPVVTGGSGQLIWYVVPGACAAAADQGEQAISRRSVVASFAQGDGFGPVTKVRQPFAVVAFQAPGGAPVACAALPAIPAALRVTFPPAPEVPASCPVTLPPTHPFIPAEDGSSPPGAPYGDYWFGSEALWTALPLDGVWGGGKEFWWNTTYNAMMQPIPPLTVTGHRLDGSGEVLNPGHPTNGFAGGAGSFMLVGIAFPSGGCWQITGTYQRHSLSFVVWVPPNTPGAATPAATASTSATALDSCPVTRAPRPVLVPSGLVDGTPPGSSQFWYGDRSFWTELSNDGTWSSLPVAADGMLTQKTLWWSPDELTDLAPNPALSVTGRRLDGTAPPLRASAATTGGHAGMGTFMVVVVRIPAPGCWQIRGAYHGHSLGFVVWVGPGMQPPATP